MRSQRIGCTFALIMALATLAGCTTMGRSFDAGKVIAPDNSLRWTHGNVVQTEGTQVVRSTTEVCDPARDASGNLVPDLWVNCRAQAVNAASDNSPGVKAANITGELGKAGILGGAAVGAAAVLAPAVTKINQANTQTGGGATVGETKATVGDTKAEATGGTGGAGGGGGAGGKGCSSSGTGSSVTGC